MNADAEVLTEPEAKTLLDEGFAPATVRELATAQAAVSTESASGGTVWAAMMFTPRPTTKVAVAAFLADHAAGAMGNARYVAFEGTPPASAGHAAIAFASVGHILTRYPAATRAFAITAALVVAGYAGSPGDFALARYNADGSLDTTFPYTYGLVWIELHRDLVDVPFEPSGIIGDAP